MFWKNVIPAIRHEDVAREAMILNKEPTKFIGYKLNIFEFSLKCDLMENLWLVKLAIASSEPCINLTKLYTIFPYLMPLKISTRLRLLC